MPIIEFFTSTATLEILFKLLVATILSAIIGIEREMIHKPAGIKTHTLICISATLVMALGIYMYDLFGSNATDPSRLPAQILAGIGFVGAGTIIRDGFSVKGITTAASLLSITCIGLAVGAGFYEGAVIATFFIFIILSFTTPLQHFIDSSKKEIMFTITVHSTPGTIGRIEKVFEDSGSEIYNIRQLHDKASQYTLLKFVVKNDNTKVKENLIHTLCKMSDVKEVYTSKKVYQNEDFE